MKKSDVLLKVSKESLSMLRTSPQNEREAVQQDRDTVICSWEKLYNSIINEYPAISKVEEEIKDKEVNGHKQINWHLLAYALRFYVVWKGDVSFMENVIDRYMHIDEYSYIEYMQRPIYLPWCLTKEFEPTKFKGKVY